MTNTAQITCISQSDRSSMWERIRSVGGTSGGGWKISQNDAIKHIESGEWSFYVSVDGQDIPVVVARNRFGNKYITTEADGTNRNSLLNLPECP